MLSSSGVVTRSVECGVDNDVSAGGCSDESHGNSCEVVTISGSDDVTTYILVQSCLKVHQMIWAVHFLYDGVHITYAPQLSSVSSEPHLAVSLTPLLLPPTFSFHHAQHRVASTCIFLQHH